MTEAELPSPKSFATVLASLPIGAEIVLRRINESTIRVVVRSSSAQNFHAEGRFILDELELSPIISGFIFDLVAEYNAELAKRQPK